MMTLDQQQLLTIFTLAVLIYATGLMMHYRRKYEALHRQHAETLRNNDKLTAECGQLRELIARNSSFAAEISEAELTMRLQAAGLGRRSEAAAGKAPERYRYFTALTQGGLVVEEIAEKLSISNQEAEQLTALARIAGSR